MKILIHLNLFCLMLIMMASCKKCNTTPPAQRDCPSCPYISEVSPNPANPGDTILLKGENFSLSYLNNEVTVAGIPCMVLDTLMDEDSLLLIKLPENAVTGEVHIRINNEDLLTNYDSLVSATKGPPPILYIGSVPNTVVIGDSPLKTDIAMEVNHAYLFDSSILYIHPTRVMWHMHFEHDQRGRQYSAGNLSSMVFSKPKFFSSNYVRNGDEIIFSISSGTYHGTTELTYRIPSNYIYPSAHVYNNNSLGNPIIPSLPNGQVYGQDGKITIRQLGMLRSNGTPTTSSGKVNYDVIPQASNFSPNFFYMGYDTNNYTYTVDGTWEGEQYMVFAAEDKILDKRKKSSDGVEYICLVNLQSKTIQNLTAGQGNFPSILNESVPLAQVKIGANGQLCKYGNSILYCDIDYGVIRKIDIEKGECTNIYQDNNLINQDFFIRKSQNSDFALFFLKNNAGKFNAYSFSFQE